MNTVQCNRTGVHGNTQGRVSLCPLTGGRLPGIQQPLRGVDVCANGVVGDEDQPEDVKELEDLRHVGAEGDRFGERCAQMMI